MRKSRQFMAAGGGVTALGVIVGVFPLSSGGVQCGGAFWESSDPLGAEYRSALSSAFGWEDYTGACQSLRQGVLLPVVLVIIVGVALFIAGLVLDDRETKAKASPVPEPVAAGGVSVEIGRLVALRDSGVLSDEEFEAAKRRVLAGSE